MNTADRRTDRATSRLPRRFLRPFLLLALDEGETTHGYELCEAVRARGVAVDLASVYRDLRNMEQHDLVTSSWEPSDVGPDRRVYTLTPIGRSAAADAVSELHAVRDGLSAALASFAARAGRAS